MHEFIASLRSRYAGHIGVAVSGGADSVFLLHALSEAGLAARVLHVNHGLRGAESDGDEAFVVRLANSLNVPVSVAKLPPPDGNLEQEARGARYTWFRQCITDGLCNTLATGHTLDDQAETVLSRFLRGAGTAGLAAILPVTGVGMIRPLLEVARETIRVWLRERDLEWREDSSNLDTSFLRNRIRHQVMPVLTAINPSLAATLASTAEWARGEEEYWASEVEKLATTHFSQRGETVLLETSKLRLHPVAVQRRLLRRAVELVRGSLRAIDFQHIEGIRRLTESREGSGRLQIPGLDILRSFDWLRLAPLGFDARLERDFQISLNMPGSAVLPERGIAVEAELVTRERVYNSDLHEVDPARLTGNLLLRNWRPGDSLQRRGAANAEKIKTLFQEHRIPLWERRAWPVIAAGSSVVWTRRFGVAKEFAAVPGSSSAVLVRDIGAPEGVGSVKGID